MITGIGTDIIEVARVAEKIGKEQGFRELVFSSAEIAYCEKATNKFQHYAARFAAKEAFFKALGTGWADSAAFNEVEIIHDKKGKPFIKLTGATAIVLQEYTIGTISVSLSHVKEMAIAVVIIES
jgi:holo-[acyl-carrier protein] synthase